MPNRHATEKNNYHKKKGTIIISTIVISSIVFSSIGFWYASRLDSSPPLVQTQKQSLKLAPGKSRSDFVENQRTHSLQIEDEKKELYKKIEELSEELKETKTRLIQLKRDILVRGGRKEIDYLNKITKLEKAELIAMENSQAIAEKDALIAQLQEEKKAAENFFIIKSGELQQAYKNELTEYQEKITGLAAIISKINLTLNISSEPLTLENIYSALENIQSKISKNSFIDSQIAHADIDHTNFLERRLDNAQEEIDRIEEQYADDYMQEEYRQEEKLPPSIESDSSNLNDKIFQLQNELQENERQLNQIHTEYKKLLEEKDRIINKQQNELNQQKNSLIQNEEGHIDVSQLETDYKSQIQKLTKKLHAANELVELAKKKEFTFDQTYYESRIQFLEDAIEIQKEALIAAQDEILKTLDEQIDSQLELFYQDQIQSLAQKNMELEVKLRGRDQTQLGLDQKSTEEIVYEENPYSSPTITANLQKMVNDLKLSLHEETKKKESIQNEVDHLRNELLNLTAKNSSYSNTIETLESSVNGLKKYNDILKEELTARESADRIETEPTESDPTFTHRLKAKIAYLSTRLNQEKEKNDHLENENDELKITLNEMKERNDQLENKLHHLQ